MTDDPRICVRTLAVIHGVSNDTIFHIFREYFGLVKKTARWVPKLITNDQKQQRVRSCTEFLATVWQWTLVILDHIVTMDELGMSFHTPETIGTQQFKQWF